MGQGGYRRRAVLGSVAATALAGCTGLERRVRGLGGVASRGRGDGGSEGDSISAEDVLDPVRRFAEAYNTNEMDALLGALTPDSPVRERADAELLERYDLPVMATERIARGESGLLVVATFTIRDTDRSASEPGSGTASERATVSGTAAATASRTASRTGTGSESGSESEFTTGFEVRGSGTDWLVHRIRGPAPMLVSGTPTDTPTADDPDEGTGTPTSTIAPLDGFEGDLAAWAVERGEWGQRDDVAYAGTYSGGITVGGPDTGDYIGTLATATPESLAGGARPATIEHYWYEREESFGGGLRLVNSRGNVELGVATDNPEWVVEGADGFTEVYGGDGYGRWIRTTIDFDWAAGTASVTFADQQSGTERGTEVTLAAGSDIERIRLSGFTSEQGWRTESCHMFWDEIRVESD